MLKQLFKNRLEIINDIKDHSIWSPNDQNSSPKYDYCCFLPQMQQVSSNSWRHDLGQSSVHHAIAQGENVNMFLIDTDIQGKKDIDLYTMNFGNVYVASVAVYSSYAGAIHALKESGDYPGPFIVLAYLPQKDYSPIYSLNQTKVNVESDLWPLYRWNPTLENQ
ncbi:thiamine diphosphate-binding protein [Backusella circina FSU 941]|nr:thiamine diphosphate-binding protein [Backusella circina FSU 941]